MRFGTKPRSVEGGLHDPAGTQLPHLAHTVCHCWSQISTAFFTYLNG